MVSGEVRQEAPARWRWAEGWAEEGAASRRELYQAELLSVGLLETELVGLGKLGAEKVSLLDIRKQKNPLDRKM